MPRLPSCGAHKCRTTPCFLPNSSFPIQSCDYLPFRVEKQNQAIALTLSGSSFLPAGLSPYGTARRRETLLVSGFLQNGDPE
jgi:hypothetical protein